MSKENTIKCPKCNFEIDVNDILYKQIENSMQKKYDFETEKLKKHYEKQELNIKNERQKLEESKKNQINLLNKKLEEQLKIKREEIKKELKQKIAIEQEEQFRLLNNELDEKSKQIKEYNKVKIEIEKIKREKDELEDKIKAEAEKTISTKLKIEKEKIRKTIEGQNLLRISEKEKIIFQLKDQLILAQKKAEQVSQQLQGEVQEIAIEEYLQNEFPLDTISEIKKGARGGDCIQTINTRERVNCGTIYYESKRTNSFQPSWIEKFKTDIREKGADIGILITQVMPKKFENITNIDGIWVCTFESFKSLILVLRDSIIKIKTALKSQENKGDKMTLLYNFLTSNEFKMEIEAIVEGFSQMKIDIDTEKRAMAKIWKQREKQIEKVVLNTINMYGSIKGIAGNAIEDIKILELDHIEEK